MSAAGSQPYSERIVRFGDCSPEGLREKVVFVIDEMERRLKTLGFGWQDAVSTQAYTVQNIGHLVGEELARRGAIETAWSGTTRGRRSSGSTTRWTCGAPRGN